MKTPAQIDCASVLLRDIRAQLEAGFGAAVVRMMRTPSIYRSSFALEDLDVEFATGRNHRFILKHTYRHALHPDAEQAKPHFLFDPQREPAVYRHVLSHDLHGTAVCYAVVAPKDIGAYVLVLERVCGQELYQVGEFEIWEEVARWLARFHRNVAHHDMQRSPELGRHLLRYDATYYRTWLSRAREFQKGDAPASEFLNRLSTRYGEVVDRLSSIPSTVIHGELYASNVLVARGNPIRVCPVDWEMAGYGPGLLDLSALVSGRWGDNQRRQLFAAYVNELEASINDQETLWSQLQYCRLFHCIQWMGWAPKWNPPADHRQDWLSTAIGLSDVLCL